MAAAMQISVSTDGGEPPAALRELVGAADASGAANVWIACHLFSREPIAAAAAALAASRRLGVVLMAMSPYTVHPVYAAMAAATLDEFFPGRVQLCFGVGAPGTLDGAGVTPERPLETLREALEIARRLLSGEPVKYSGRRYRISGRLAMGAHAVPLWLAASGPQMLELAGETADGVVISAGTSPAFIRWCFASVRRGEERGRRSIKKAALVLCSMDPDAHRAHERVRRRLGFVLRGPHHARNLELAGTTLDQGALSEAFSREDWKRVDELMSDDAVARHSASGTSAQVRAALEAYRIAGLDEIVAYGLPERDHVRQMLEELHRQPAEIGR